jgi:hypothetical protein
MADIWSADNWQAVTPTDDTDVAFNHNAIYVGTGGVIAVRKASGGAVTQITVPNGALLPIKVYSIDSTNTTASGILLVR